MDRLYRANISTCAAIGADFGINFIDVTLRDSFNGAFVDAGSASGAIVTYFISHDLVSLCPSMIRTG